MHAHYSTLEKAHEKKEHPDILRTPRWEGGRKTNACALFHPRESTWENRARRTVPCQNIISNQKDFVVRTSHIFTSTPTVKTSTPTRKIRPCYFWLMLRFVLRHSLSRTGNHLGSSIGLGLFNQIYSGYPQSIQSTLEQRTLNMVEINRPSTGQKSFSVANSTHLRRFTLYIYIFTRHFATFHQLAYLKSDDMLATA